MADHLTNPAFLASLSARTPVPIPIFQLLLCFYFIFPFQSQQLRIYNTPLGALVSIPLSHATPHALPCCPAASMAPPCTGQMTGRSPPALPYPLCTTTLRQQPQPLCKKNHLISLYLYGYCVLPTPELTEAIVCVPWVSCPLIYSMIHAIYRS